MKQRMTLAGIFLAVAFCLASCNGNNQAKQNEQETESQEAPQERMFTTNTGTFPYEKTLNYWYTEGYSRGGITKTSLQAEKCREEDFELFEAHWTASCGVPTSTEEAREAYEACFERYKEGYDEAFYK